jgi:hypothetical protein
LLRGELCDGIDPLIDINSTRALEFLPPESCKICYYSKLDLNIGYFYYDLDFTDLLLASILSLLLDKPVLAIHLHEHSIEKRSQLISEIRISFREDWATFSSAINRVFPGVSEANWQQEAGTMNSFRKLLIHVLVSQGLF